LQKEEVKVVECNVEEEQKEEVKTDSIEEKVNSKEKSEDDTWTCDKCKTVNKISAGVICKSKNCIVNNRMLSSEQEFAEEAVIR